MVKKEPENPNYHMGKRTGYELINGEYHIAPLYTQQFEELTTKQKGIETMLAMVTNNVSQQLEQIHIAAQRIWEELSNDIGIDRKEGFVYLNGIVKKQEKPGAEAKKE
ncbi:MAG: hypothetical protein M0Q12_00805 [Synergistaceae bacterium]|jgi:hypothetical protein|nr:hypothetical protein [Synergistaceae bacterium]